VTRTGRNSIGTILSHRLRERSEQIASEWLARLLERLPEGPHDVFPDRSLLDHIPELVDRISTSLASETEIDDVLSADVLHELRLLAQLRRAQGYDLKELLAELEVLGEVVAHHIIELVDQVGDEPSAAEGVRVAGRLQRVLFAMGLVGAEVFLQEGTRQRLRRSEILASFSRAVTHELRNRIQPAVLGVNIARSHLAAGRLREADQALDRVEASIARVDQIPPDLLGITIARQGKLAFPIRREPLDRVIRRAIDGLLPYAAVHEVAVRTKDPLPSMLVDAGRLQLVLVNLLSNAVKYRDLDKRERWVEVRAAELPDAAGVRVEVEDNGIGIADEQLVRIFDDRFRAHADRPYEGEGLGLALAHEVLLQLGARLDVESQVGHGTRFGFRLASERDAAAG
jgi:signal transduction histidine kinase